MLYEDKILSTNMKLLLLHVQDPQSRNQKFSLNKKKAKPKISTPFSFTQQVIAIYSHVKKTTIICTIKSYKKCSGH